MNKQDKCDHDWEYVKDWRNKMNIKSGEIIEIPQKCMKCGLEADEVWIYSCVVGKDGKEIC